MTLDMAGDHDQEKKYGLTITVLSEGWCEVMVFST
jgi:hypothetical protein